MNYGPLVFLAAFFALASSWCGFVLTPQLQIGRLQQTNTVGSAAATYPVARPGLARQGLEIYRANGCAYCHSQQVGQTGAVLDIALADAGTNHAATITALLKLAESATNQPNALTLLAAWQPGRSNAPGAAILEGLPKAFFRSSDQGGRHCCCQGAEFDQRQSPALGGARRSRPRARLGPATHGRGGFSVRLSGNARFAARRS